MKEQHNETTSSVMEGVTESRYFGLNNQGATCYLNSILQVLFMTKDFREALKKNSCDSEFIDSELTALFEKLQRNTAETTGITKKLGINKVYEQCDAAEYIEKILDGCSKEASQIFQGETTDRTVCDVCDEHTDDATPFWNLPLALKTNVKNDSVEEAVKKFFEKSFFREPYQMYCDKCCRKCDASSGTMITCYPDVLMLLLKRFEFKYTHNALIKNNCIVEFPNTLNIPENYEIYAFVEHTGSLQSGHYTATIKCQNGKGDKWIKFNDSNVMDLVPQPFTEGNQTLHRSQSVYLLFYRKKSLTDNNIYTDNGVSMDNNVSTDNNTSNDNNVYTDNNTSNDNDVYTDNNESNDNNVYTDNNESNDNNVYTDSNVSNDNDVYTDNNESNDNNEYTDSNVSNDTNVYTDNNVSTDTNVYTDNNVYTNNNVYTDNNNVSTDSDLCELLCNPNPDTEPSSDDIQDSLPIAPNPHFPNNTSNLPNIVTDEVAVLVELDPATDGQKQVKPWTDRRSVAERCCPILLMLFFLLVFLFYCVVLRVVLSEKFFGWSHSPSHQNVEFSSLLYSVHNRSQ